MVVQKALYIILIISRPLTLLEMNVIINIENILQYICDLDLEEEKDFKLSFRS